MISCVMFDFGGVVIESPFVAFAKFEADTGLPAGFLQLVNSTDPDDNAWAKLERNDVTIDEFDTQFANESEKLGHRVSGRDVLQLLHGAVRPGMRRALNLLPELGYRIVCLTNNVVSEGAVRSDIADAMSCFERVFESSRMGSRKPETDFYQAVLDAMEIDPSQAVFMDDLGINLKPARAMGISTIKVVDEVGALQQLADILNEPSIVPA